MGWKEAKKHAEERPEFVSLKDDGDTVDFVALTEPAPAKKPGFERGQTREVYRVLVLVLADKTPKARTLDLSLRQFEAYAESVGEGHELSDVVRMTRSGKVNDTNTSYGFQLLRKVKAAEATKVRAAGRTVVNV